MSSELITPRAKEPIKALQKKQRSLNPVTTAAAKPKIDVNPVHCPLEERSLETAYYLQNLLQQRGLSTIK